MDALTGLLGTTPAVFIGLTVILVGGAAILTGRAVAGNWKPAWQVVPACFGLALADRFLIYALFQGQLARISWAARQLRGARGAGPASWRIAKVGKLVGQYPWRYQRTSPFAYQGLNGRREHAADHANAACQCSSGPRIIRRERRARARRAPALGRRAVR